MSLEKFIPVVFVSTNLTNCSQVKETYLTFTSVGFVFMKNHGIDRKLVLYINTTRGGNQIIIIYYTPNFGFNLSSVSEGSAL